MNDGSAALRLGEARQLTPQWSAALIAASIAISLLGAFTSTQLVCQAKISRYFTGVLVWTLLGSLTFGFCSIWSLHEVAMLAYELDLRIGIDVGLTILSAILAVTFTFFALASDMLYDRYSKGNRSDRQRSRRKRKPPETMTPEPQRFSSEGGESAEPLLQHPQRANGIDGPDVRNADPANVSYFPDPQLPLANGPALDSNTNLAESSMGTESARPSLTRIITHTILAETPTDTMGPGSEMDSEGESVSYEDTNSFTDGSRRSSSHGDSTAGAFRLGSILTMKHPRREAKDPTNPVIAICTALYLGLTIRNTFKGFFWALAITSMHYVGIRALRVPEGYVKLDPFLVALSGVICWVVCVVGCILILEIETNLGQQLLFSVVATCGVAAMHFTGMRAATFYTYSSPTEIRGYPPGLATAIAVIAISTCIAANLLLAHSATVSRNKLAEIVWTRRKLWMAIAQKEAAETAAAARSDFIASASHEIRTPLHHLQGYSDLLSRTELTDDGRVLLYAIQRATQTLSLITNNVLDWSRLENDGETTCRPVSLDVRTICESIITLLPNQDDEADVELMVVVSPDVPRSLFIDETYIHRILMNLVSNALKFTSSGYVLLLVRMQGDNLMASITDTGCGVPTSFLPQLFEPFKQAQMRGKARGTGLGLSIIKQLLTKMNGAIEVESRYQDDEGIGTEKSGSVFTVTIPVQPTPSSLPDQDDEHREILMFHGGSDRVLEGLKTSWEQFNYTVHVAQRPSDISGSDAKYIWADLASLKKIPGLLSELAEQTQSIVLVPYDMQSSLYEVHGLLNTPQHIIPIQKPLIWHAIKKRISAAGQRERKLNLPRTVRFDTVVTELSEAKENEPPSKGPYRHQSFANSFADEQAVVQATAAKPNKVNGLLVLLVEDNPINCKLGKKMLQSLGYSVILAEDGVIAIQQILKHDAEVDVILMDQSMPRKDGLTATKEIRAMENDGTLSRRRPIIAVSAVVSSEAQALFRQAGAEDFLAKPLSLGKLEETLATHLHRA